MEIDADLNDEYNSLEFYAQNTNIDAQYEIVGKGLGVAVNFQLPVAIFKSDSSGYAPLKNLYFRLNYDENDIDEIDGLSVKSLDLEIDSTAFKIAYVIKNGSWHYIPFIELQNGDLKDALGDIAEIEEINYGISARRLLEESAYFDIVSFDLGYRNIDNIKLSRELTTDPQNDAFVIDPTLVNDAISSAYWLGVDVEKELHPNCYFNIGLSTYEFKTLELKIGMTSPF